MRSARFWVAYGALAAAVALLVPTLLPLSGSMDAFADDLSNGTFRPFGPPPGKTSARSFSGSLGGFTGTSPGNYLPGAAEIPPTWLMDRDGSGGNVVIDAVFNPSLGAMKRLKAYDAVGADGATLTLADARLRPAAPDNVAGYDQVIEASFPVQFRAGEPIPIFSPHPKAVVNAFSTAPAIRGGTVQFLRDGADTLYALAPTNERITLNITFLTASAYYAFDPPAGLHATDYPASARPVLPPGLQEDAKVVLARAGIDDTSDLGEALRTLNRYFRSFTEGEIPQPSEVESLYLALALGGHGCCRHRAFAYMITAQSIGVPTRVVVNEAHAFVEMMMPDGRWTQVNLGGCGTYTVNNPNDYPDYFPQADDPRGEANPTEDRPLPTVVTITNITESPARIVKGERYFVNGTVVASDGRGVPGARVDVFLNETKTAPGRLTGAGTTDAQGRFAIVARVPKELPARAYQLVARAADPGGAQVRYLDSWSDPEVDVFAPTRFVLPTLRAAAGFPVNLTGQLADTDGTPIARATIRWSADNVSRPPIVTDANGSFVAPVEFETTGPKPLVLVYDGDDPHGPANTTAVVSVETGAILLPPQLPPGARGETATVRGQVAISGVALAGRVVEGTLVDATRIVARGTATTADDGAFALDLDLPAGLPPGNHTLRLVSPALRLQAEAPMRVAIRPVLTVEPPGAFSQRERIVVEARLVDDTGAPLADKPLRLLVDQNASSARGLTTNRTGVARFDLPAQPTGAHEARIVFAGDAQLVEAAQSVTIQVVPPWYASVPTWAWTTLAVGVVLLALAAWLFREGGVGRRVATRIFVQRAARWRLEVAFPQHPPGVEPAFERAERVHVRIGARDREGRAVEPRVRVLQPIDARGRAAGDGFDLEVDAPQHGTLVVEARAAGFARLWTSPVRVEVPVTTYREMVERGFVELRRRAQLDPSASPGDLVRALGPRAPPAAVRDAAVLFEVADYSERPVDRAFYHRFSRARLTVERALEGA